MVRRFVIVASFSESLIKFRWALIEKVMSLSIEVHAVVPEAEREAAVVKQLISRGVNVSFFPLQRTGMNPLKDCLAFFSLCMLMARIKPNFYLGYTVKPVIYGGMAAWLFGVEGRFPLVTGLGYAFTGSTSGKRLILRRLIQSLYRFSLVRSQKVFFQNPDDESLFRELKILPARIPSCVVNGSGVDVAEYPVSDLPSTPSFLLIARLLGDKGVREYVSAAKIVKSKYPYASFKLVGWIDENPDAISQQELAAWINEGTVEYLGKLADVRPAIVDSGIYVLPSYREGTPRTVLEAMAMGRAVITTDAPGCRETVVDGYNGFLVPVQNVEALAAAMCRLVESPELVATMGKRSRLIAEEKYDVQKVNALMLNEMGII